MVVSGMSTGTRYVLGKKGRPDADGMIYNVPDMPHTMVKVYNKNSRPVRERMVIDAINGVGAMAGPQPMEAVYGNGRFVGYTFQADLPEESASLPMAAPSRIQDRTNWTVVNTLCIGLCAVLTLVWFLVGPSLLERSLPEAYVHFNFKGIPLMIGGWAAMLVMLYWQHSTQAGEVPAITKSMLAFVLGCAAVFVVICLLVLIVQAVLHFVFDVLPVILMVIAAIVVAVIFVRLFLKSFHIL